MAKVIVAFVLIVLMGLVAARIYVARLNPIEDGDDTLTVAILQKKMNLPKALVGQQLNALSPGLDNLFSKSLGGEHRDIEIALIKWNPRSKQGGAPQAKFFVVSVRGQKILDAVEGPFWGEDQGWFVGCIDKPTKKGGSPLENSVAFAGWQDNQRKIVIGWRVEKLAGQLSQMPQSELDKIDCSKVPGWIEDFEDSEEGS